MEKLVTPLEKDTSLFDYIADKPFDQIKTELEAEPLNIKVNDKDKLYICKYSQIDSDFNYKIVRQCRGIILEKTTNNIVAYPFDKFFNLAEPRAEKVNFELSSIQEKVDGCCDENTKIITESGEKSIKEICENKYQGKILGYDVETGMPFYTPIIDYSIKNNNNDWYEIELENGEKIKLTGNHRIWLPELHCYRAVKDLVIQEKILLVKYVINKIEEIIS